jgi:D-galactose 1-dehydrogenase
MNKKTISIGIVGFGKIAQDQHVPSLAGNSDFSLVAVTKGHQAPPAGVAEFARMDAMLAGLPGLNAVALCTPPQVRYQLARQALERGLHVMLEKPPCQTLSEAEDLIELASARGLTLFAAWHSREAPAVEPAREWISKRTVRSVTITWREDVRRWHPGQRWLWEPGGFGVFDPGINALSIVTHILPGALFVKRAELDVPANCSTPIAVRMDLTDAAGIAVHADFDFRQEGHQTWTILVETTQGNLLLSEGGALMSVDGVAQTVPKDAEYPNLYRRFAELIGESAMDVDLAPLRLVADAGLVMRTRSVEAFHD